MTHTETIHFSWSISYANHKKDSRWHLILAAVSLALLVAAILLKSYLFSLVILIGYFLIISMANKEHADNQVEISELGIMFNNEEISYSKIKSFEITKKEKRATLLFDIERNLNPVLMLEISPEINLYDLKDYLSENLEENKIRVPLTDQILEKMGL